MSDDVARSGAPEPGLAFAFEARVRLGPIVEIGIVDGVRSRIVPIVGGSVEGARLSAEVLPGGADWQTVSADAALTRVHARYWLRADDGATIAVDNAGLRSASPEVGQRLIAGEALSAADYYFRTTPRFEAGEGAHAWLNHTIFVGVGARLPDLAVIRVYAVT